MDKKKPKVIDLFAGVGGLSYGFIPHIKRDISKIEVGDVLVADGKRLNFQVIIRLPENPAEQL